jgi:hypothetical protein
MHGVNHLSAAVLAHLAFCGELRREIIEILRLEKLNLVCRVLSACAFLCVHPTLCLGAHLGAGAIVCTLSCQARGNALVHAWTKPSQEVLS